MARVRFDDLVREGGTLEEPPKVGAAETFVNKAVGMIPGANRLVDAVSAGLIHAGSSGGERAKLTPQAEAELRAMGEEVQEAPGLVDRYREVRDERAARTEVGGEQNPWAGRLGSLTGFGLSLAAPLPKAAGTGLGASVKTGAGYGAFAGLTEGSADLTRGEAGQALEDTAKGAALGGLFGAGGHALVRGGQMGVRALRNAREDVLAQETMAAQEAAEAGLAAQAKDVDAHRKLVGQARAGMAKDFASREAAAAKEAEALERQHGQALEANKARGARAERQAARATDQERNLIGQARELNKRFDAGKARELERQIAEAERGAEAERRMVGEAREIDKARSLKQQNEQGRALEMNKARDAKDRNMVGQAREMNKRADRQGLERARRILEKARQRNEDPSTKVLEGYAGKAGERRAVNFDRVDRYREKIQDPNLNTKASSRLQRYVDDYADAVDDPAAFERRFIERYLRENHGDEVAERIMRERVGPNAEIMPRPAPVAEPLPAGAPQATDEALPLLPELETAPGVVREPVLAPRPVRTEGASPQALGVDGRPGPMSMEPTPITPPVGRPKVLPPENSMVAPIDAPLPPEAVPTRSVQVPNIQRPAPAAPPTPPAPPAPAAPVPAVDEVQDLTRLAGPGDVAPIAAERAAQREKLLGPAGILRTTGRAVSEGVRSGNSTLGAIFGGIGALGREAFRDPAVRAKALSAAKFHLLAQANPEVFARVGRQLTQAAASGDPRARAMHYVRTRKDPELREAERKASEEAARLTDQQLMDLIAGAAPGG